MYQSVDGSDDCTSSFFGALQDAVVCVGPGRDTACATPPDDLFKTASQYEFEEHHRKELKMVGTATSPDRGLTR